MATFVIRIFFLALVMVAMVTAAAAAALHMDAAAAEDVFLVSAAAAAGRTENSVAADSPRYALLHAMSTAESHGDYKKVRRKGPVADLPECKSLLRKRLTGSCRMAVADAHPTQLAFGRLASICKQQNLEDIKTEAELDDFLLDSENVVPLLAFRGRFFVLDHHHLIRSLHDANLKVHKHVEPMQREFVAVITEDWTTRKDIQDDAQLWAEMARANYAWLKTADGRQITPAEAVTLMPTVVVNLENDPMRTLSFVLRRYGGYGKVSHAYYVEFRWADWTRSFFYYSERHLSSVDSERERLSELFDLSMHLARHKQSRHLPGYDEGVKDPPSCPLLHNIELSTTTAISRQKMK